MTNTQIAQEIVADQRNRDMAERVAYEIGRDEGSALQHTCRSLTADELATVLADQGWTWSAIVRANF